MKKDVFSPPPTKIGVYDISNDAYHAMEGISRTALWTFKQLPQKYWYEYLSGEYEAPKEKESYIIGNLLHCVVLEPDKFDENYYIVPKVNRTTKQGKIDWESSIIEANNRILITQEQLDLVCSMRDTVLAQSVVGDVLHNALIEKAIFWEDKETGILCKSKPDIWNTPICADLKTTEDASLRAFQLSALKYGYFLQAAMVYEALLSVDASYEKFLFICVEKKQPHAVGLYLLDDEALQFGRDLFHSLLRKFADCKEKNVWPDYGVQMLMIPKYATMDLQDE